MSEIEIPDKYEYSADLDEAKRYESILKDINAQLTDLNVQMHSALETFKTTSGLEKQHVKGEVAFLVSEIKRLEEQKKACEKNIKISLSWHHRGAENLKNTEPENDLLQ